MKRSIWSDDYKQLRKALKKMRLENHLSQHQLAILLDKPRTFVTKYENADRNLDFIEVIKICRACDLDPVVFLRKLLDQTHL